MGKSAGKSRLGSVLAIIGTAALLCVVGASVAAYMFWQALLGKPEDRRPLSASEIEGISNIINHPELLDDKGRSHSQGVFAGLAGKAKAKVVDIAVKQGVEELRGELAKAGASDEERAKKVMEIVADIQNNYQMNDKTYKMFTREFVDEGMRSYIKETTPAERATFDPIVHCFLNKLNNYSKSQQGQ